MNWSLPELLKNVAKGNHRYTITHRGEPVAELVPVNASQDQEGMVAARQMLAFMKGHHPIERVEIKSLIAKGRD